MVFNQEKGEGMTTAKKRTTKRTDAERPMLLSEDGKRFADAVARHLDGILNRVERHGLGYQASQRDQLIGLLQLLRGAADGKPVQIVE